LAIGGLEQDDLIEGLLLQMVFCDACHTQRLKNLPKPGTGRTMPKQPPRLLQRGELKGWIRL
jgi:hypothetical protein